MKRVILYFLAVLLFIAAGSSELWAMAQTPRGPKKYIRVAVAQKKDAVDLHLRGRYRLLCLKADKFVKEGKNLKVRVAIDSGILFLDEESLKTADIRIETDSRASIIVDGRQFRGIMDIIAKPDNTLLLVNHVDLEEYLCGVLHNEVPHLWPMQALKAQAIASRTFALYQHQINKEKEFDLTDTVFSQVYGGAAHERYRTNRAVIKTYGQALTVNQKLFPAYFHACCGGHTLDADKLWNIDLPVLKGRPCPHCKLSLHFDWSRKVSIWLVRKELISNGYECGKITAFEPAGYDASGRVTDIIIKTTQSSIRMPSNKFRLMISPTLIKSTNFTVRLEDEFLYFQGQGWGHGVGLCQWGAWGMARQGYKAQEILNYYYPGSRITDIWENDAYFK